MAKVISGIAIFPRLSENDVFYWPQELKKFDGKTVPLRWNHIQSDDAIIGEATFSYDETNRQVLYKAVVTNPDAQKEIDKGGFKVSIGATVDQEACKDPEKCSIKHQDGSVADAPVLDTIEELSVVADPGIPESSLHILENKHINCGNPVRINNITSTKDKAIQEQVMTSETIKEDCDCQKAKDSETQAPAQDAPVEKVEQECPPGKVFSPQAGTCVDEKKEDEAVDTPQDSDKNVNVTVNLPKQEQAIDVDAIKTEAKEQILEEIRKEWKPTAKVNVSESAEPQWVTEEKELDGEAIMRKVLTEGHATFSLNKEDWFKSRVTEGITTAGTVPTTKGASDIVIIPGNNTFKPMRQFGQFAQIPQGSNTHKFFTLDVQAFGDISAADETTDITASTHNLTAIDVTCTPRGILQQVLKTEIEDFPPSFMNTLKETLRLAAIKDESNLIVQTIADTNSDFNNGTTALAAGFPGHIAGNDGSFVDANATEDAAGEFLKEGLEVAREILETRGHDPVNEKIVAVLSPRAYRTLVSDPDISEFVQIGDPSTTKLGRLEQFLGIEIIVSNELRVLNNAYRNVVFVAGKAWGLASQRDMEVEMTKEIRGQFVDIVASHRIGVDEIDKTSYVIVSSFES